MWVDILLASILGGIVALDTTALLQIMISRPIVACSVAGIILGNFPLGFIMGILLELLYISELPVGAAKFAESNVGSTAAATIAILVTEQLPSRPYTIIALALILTVLISSFSGRLVLLMRQMNDRIYENLVYKENLSPWHINFAQLFGIAMAFFLGFAVILSTSTISLYLLPKLLGFVPVKYEEIFKPAMGSVLAVGCVFLLQHFWRQNQKKWVFFLGIGFGMILFIKFL